MNINPLKYNKLIALKITEEDFKMIKVFSEKDNISVSEFIRNAIEEKKQQKEIEQQMEISFN